MVNYATLCDETSIAKTSRLERKLAGARENRTHSGWLNQPAHGFEDREDHQTPSAPSLAHPCYRFEGISHWIPLTPNTRIRENDHFIA